MGWVSTSRRRSTKAMGALAIEQLRVGAKYPMAGIAACCARAASGHAAAPPSSVMNSRRLN
jgi:hypothetical protein